MTRHFSMFAGFFLAVATLAVPAFPAVALAASTQPVEILVIEHAQATAPRGAQRVPFLTLEVHNSCAEDVSITGILLQHEGRGETDDLSRVYAMKDGIRISDAVAVKSRGEARLKLRGWTVKKCGIGKIDIVADIASDAAVAGEHRLKVAGETAINAGGRTLAITFETATRSVRTAPVSEGSVHVEALSLTKPVRFGNQRTVARFSFTADNTRDLQALSLTLTNDGKARNAEVKNLFLETSRGERVTNMLPALEGDKAVFVFTKPFSLPRNETRLLEVNADIVSSRRNTIRFELEEPSDLLVQPARR